MDDKQRAEALWAYSITHERIMERLVRKGYFSQEKADVILDMLFDQISEIPLSRSVILMDVRKRFSMFNYLYNSFLNQIDILSSTIDSTQ